MYLLTWDALVCRPCLNNMPGELEEGVQQGPIMD